jgi:hypothetical protein
MTKNPMRSIIRRAGERSPAILRAIRGSTLGLSEARRGTALVIILGALALISVITIVYVSLGQADRRAGANAVRQDNVKATVETVRDYIAQVIADDTFSVYVNGRKPDPAATNANANPVVSLVRKNSTYPFTDPWRRISLTPLAGAAISPDAATRRFNPTGSYADDVQNGVDARVPSAPFLASTTPIWLRENALRKPEFLYRRDWGHISCLSPDGRFVNLSNLAPVINTASGPVRYSGFDAKSGIPILNNTTFAVDTAKFSGPRDLSGTLDPDSSWMSWGLTLMNPVLDPKTKRPVSQRATDPQYRFDPLYTATTDTAPTAAIADPNVPAHWSMYQLNAVRPMRDFDYGPDSPEYVQYTWADVDGDGIPDSRWFEMVDASDPNHVVSLLPSDGKYRWFVAARVTDLSALANVNIATDFLHPARPGAAAGKGVQATPVGFQPSDIDLRRLLTLEDFRYQYANAFFGGSANSVYSGFLQPLNTVPPIPPSNYSGFTSVFARNAADRGYNAIRDVLQASAVGVPAANANYQTPVVAPFFGDERWNNYNSLTRRIEGVYSAGSIQGAGLFGNADLLELLRYRTANDPEITSRLEQVIDGRYNQSSGGTIATSAYGPLRSNRDLELERMVLPDVAPTGPAQYDIDDAAMARLAFDVRQYLTTMSGTRLLRAGPIDSTKAAYLDASEMRINAIDALNAATRVTALDRDPSLLFQGFCDALAPYSGLTGAWANPVPTTEGVVTAPANNLNIPREATATLNYAGNRGPIGRWSPELAIRLAAHMTANTIAAYGTDTDGSFTPPAFTLLLDDNANFLNAPSQQYFIKFPWWYTPQNGAHVAFSGRLDLDADTNKPARLANTKNGVDLSPAAQNGAINIFGIKPQPFLVQASSFCLYKSHFQAQNDEDPPPPPLVVVHGDVPEGAGAAGSEADYLGQIIAFQLYNPFNTKVRLTGPDSTAVNGSGGGETGGEGGSGAGNSGNFGSGDWSDYYIEYNGYLFKLAALSSDGSSLSTVTLDARETRVFYALSIPRTDMDSRIGAPGSVSKIVDAQFKITDTSAGGTTSTPVEIQRIKVPSGSFSSTALADADPVDFFKNKGTDSASSRLKKARVLLWRTLGSSDPTLNDADSQGKIARNRNDRRNDMLADVLDEAAGVTNFLNASLDRRLSNGDHKVGNLTQTDAPEGVSFAFFGTIKRHDDPAAPKNSIPAFLIEPKRNWTNSGSFHNIGGTDIAGFAASDGNVGDITGSAVTGSSALRPGRKGKPNSGAGSVVDALTLAAGPEIHIKGMNDPAHSKSVSTVGTTSDTLNVTSIDGRSLEQVRIELPVHQPLGTTTTTTTSTNPFIRSATINGVQTTVNTLRVADLAAALAVGPEYDPSVTVDPTSDLPSDPDHWITLSQAMALAMNYTSPGDTPAKSNPPLTSLADADFTVYARLGDPRPFTFTSPNENPPPVPEASAAVDRGHLVLDRFAPFEDLNGNGVFDANDVKRFPGVPLALNIFNIFDTRTSTRTDATTLALSPAASGLTTLVPGLININTAPLAVLRLVPLLSPTTEQGVWTQWLADAGLTSATNTTFLLPRNDLASSVFAYRERLAMRAHGADDSGAINNNTLIEFEQSSVNTAPTANDRIEAFGMLDGRSMTTNIGALHESPGFSIPGEVLAIVDRGNRRGLSRTNYNANNPSGRSTTRIPADQQMDVLANDSLKRGQFNQNDAHVSGYPGTNTALYPPTGNTDLVTSGVKDAWTEKLIAASGTLGTTSTRSDIFAVWFIVHGYQRSDTENLRPADVITPSIAKRFVMVVDRSNVVSKGQKPRIVLFTEVPMPEN